MNRIRDAPAERDILKKSEQLGVEISEWYPENDVSAFKKKRPEK